MPAKTIKASSNRKPSAARLRTMAENMSPIGRFMGGASVALGVVGQKIYLPDIFPRFRNGTREIALGIDEKGVMADD